MAVAMTPRYVAPLFRPLDALLIAVLRGLTPAQWELPTVAGNWRVRDVAAHLLDGGLRKLAAHRDGHLLATEPPRDYAEVVALINGLNATGVAYAARLSAPLLVDLLEVTGDWLSTFTESLDPHAPALFPVAWAGENASENWMDTGREYTERWHHQMQIRDAVGAGEALLEDGWYEPLLDFSVRALPRAYAEVEAASGTALTFEVDALVWSLVRDDDAWHVLRGRVDGASTSIRISRANAWRLLYNALTRDAAREAVAFEGDPSLLEPLLRARAVMV